MVVRDGSQECPIFLIYRTLIDFYPGAEKEVRKSHDSGQ
jgi:hypothetical protein